MPLTSSAKKALKQDRARREINDLTRHKIKSAVKAARLAIVAGEKDASEKLNAAYRELDVASKKNVIHKNRAARLKSRLTKKMTKVAAAPATIEKPRPKADQPVAEVKKAPAKKSASKKK